jgi:hypothetical protein
MQVQDLPLVRSYKMKPTYEKVESIFGESCIKATYENGLILLIPEDPANSDYQAYLLSLEINP